MGDVAQVAIWGILVSHAGHTISSSSWKGFSTLLRSTVYLVLLLVTFSASLSINDFWFYGTSTANGDLNRILRGSLLEALGPVVIGATAVIVQCVLLVRASKVSRPRMSALTRANFDRGPPGIRSWNASNGCTSALWAAPSWWKCWPVL